MLHALCNLDGLCPVLDATIRILLPVVDLVQITDILPRMDSSDCLNSGTLFVCLFVLF